MNDCGHEQQFLDMREALSATSVDHIGLSVAEAITLLAKQRDEARAMVTIATDALKYLSGHDSYLARYPAMSALGRMEALVAAPPPAASDGVG